MKTIIEMAEEAGFEIIHNMILVGGWEINPYMQRFAALVRADERDAVVQLIKELRPAIRPLEGMGKFMTTEEWFAVLVENIRARGNT